MDHAACVVMTIYAVPTIANCAVELMHVDR